MEGRRAWGLALAPAALALGLTAWRYFPFFADDSFISLRYSRRLLAGKGLTWDDYDAVEGYSNLLWVLLVALLGAFGIELVLAARILGAVCVLAMFGALAWTVRPDRHGPVPAGLAALALAVAGPFSVWALAGLEQPLVAATLAWGVALAQPLLNGRGDVRTALIAGVPLALLVWSRPDSPLFVAGLAIGVVLAGRIEGLRRAVALVALPLGAWLAQLAFRVVTYGEVVPNTAIIKARTGFTSRGIDYVGEGLLVFLPILLLAAPALLTRTRRWEVGTLLGIGAAWLVYLASVGGDIFPAYRHFVPLLALIGVLVGEAGVVVASWRRSLQVALGVVSVGLLGISVYLQLDGDTYRKAAREDFEWDHKVVGELLNAAFSEQQPLYAMNAAGALAYYADLPSLDMLGLCDRHIARTPPRKGYPLAHDHGDGRYVLDRGTDLVQSQLNGKGLAYLSGRQLLKDPRFARDYTEVRFLAQRGERTLTIPMYVRTEGRVGLQRSDDRVLVPPFLFGGAAGRLDDGQMVGVMQRARTETLEVPVDRGVWSARVVPATGPSPTVDQQGEGCEGPVSLAVVGRRRVFAGVELVRTGDCP